MLAVEIGRWACGGFFLTALLTGIWKYAHIRASETSSAPVYVDISHRAAFLYSFSCLVLVHFAQISKWSDTVDALGVGVAVLFFVTAQSTYIIHGFLRDTDNQLETPHKLGKSELPGALVHAYMLLLIAGEVGGFLVVFTGAMFPIG